MGGSVIQGLTSVGRLLSHNFVAQFSSAGALTGRALFDGTFYGSTDPSGTGRGLRDLNRPVDLYLRGGSAGTFWIQYSCVASHGSYEKFLSTTLSSGVGGGIIGNDGNKRGFSYTKL